MNVNLNLDLFLYGVLLAGLGVLAHRLAPDFGYVGLITGIAGGVLVAFLGVLGFLGFRRPIWPIATLIVLDVALLVQAVRAWLSIKGGAEGLTPVALILTMLLAIGIEQLVSFLQESSREKKL